MKKTIFWGSLLLFTLLAVMVNSQLLETYDRSIILFFEKIRTGFFNSFFYLFTEMGSIKTLLPAAVLVSIGLAIKRHYWEACFFMLAFWGSRGANHLLKGMFERERPAFNSLIEAGGYSFPSGHAMNATVFFGFLFYLFIYVLRKGNHHSTAWRLTVTVLVTLIAVSRVYLGVHYLTDVIAGACAGLLFLGLVVYLYTFVISRKSLRQQAMDKNE